MHNMARITFSIDDELAAAAEQRAKQDRRSLSAHISLLVERDAQAAGVFFNGKRAEVLAAVDEVNDDDAVLAVIRGIKRRKKKAA
jgi:membrane peptidoglycan carboxypeptidase